MRTLIELYEPEEPILNYLSAAVLQPDRVVFIGDAKISHAAHQNRLRAALGAAASAAEVRFIVCEGMDLPRLTACLNGVLEQYGPEDCTLDVSGGRDEMLLAAGMCCAARPVQIVSYRPGANRVSWLWGENAGQETPFDVRLTVEGLLAMAGGKMMRHGHVDNAKLPPDVLALIPRIFRVYFANRQQWPAFVQYLQQVNRADYMQDGVIRAPLHIPLNQRTCHADTALLGALAEAGAIRDFRMDSRECSFAFYSDEVGRYLCDVGAWLELYVYTVMKRSGLFDDVQMNVVVSWDNDEDNADTVNEIDLMATAGIGQLFISCKTSVPDAAVLNEIAAITRRFGGRFATPVLAAACDLRSAAPAVFRRAVEMGISVLDADDLPEGKLLKKLTELKRKWDR